nr:winged helix-turn-helix domain-containing protein [Thermococcus sp.]
MEYETIEVDDERAKELAQILMNDKAIAILRLLQERELSISEIARELNMPISTVSYHVEKMARVGLVEVAGKKYGKRLQEVRLYRASERPILLVPGKVIKKKGPSLVLDRLRVISLVVAVGLSAVAYWLASVITKPSQTKTTERVRSFAVNTLRESGQSTGSGWSALPLLIAGITFLGTLGLFHILRKRF